jgi:DNA-directed RNA polymerase subunit RPC12/RpoP
MLVSCKPGCRLGIGTTIIKLDIDTGQAICMECGDEVENISAFCKQNMRNNRDVISRSANRAFTFSCLTCKSNTETIYVDGDVLGIACEEGGCSFNIPMPMIEALKQRNSYTEEGDNEGE